MKLKLTGFLVANVAMPIIVGGFMNSLLTSQHLDRYLAEFDYRYNTRGEKDGIRMIEAIKKSNGKRLQYKELIAG
jgi:hypothetical protein